MAVDDVATDRRRKDVGRVSLAGPLGQDEISGADTLLRPQLGHCQVPDSSDAGAAAYSNGRTAVRTDPKGSSETQVLGDCRQAQTLGGPLYDAGELGLARAQSN
eukprot:2385980-Alexandrium_andersonii.AAC.1